MINKIWKSLFPGKAEEKNSSKSSLENFEKENSFTNEELKDKIKEFLKTSDKLSAIKFVREKTNLGLKEAKDKVEEIEKEL